MADKVRCSKRTMIEMMQYAAHLMSIYNTPRETFYYLQKRHKNVSDAAIKLAIKRAKLIMKKWSERTFEESRSDAISFYTTIVKGAKSISVKMAAQRALDQIRGINAPIKVAQTNSQGEDIPMSDLVSRLSGDESIAGFLAFCDQAIMTQSPAPIEAVNESEEVEVPEEENESPPPTGPTPRNGRH